MTQQQFVQEFKSYPKAQKSIVIRRLLQIMEKDLAELASNNNEPTIGERKAVDGLRGIADVQDKTPPTDEAIKSEGEFQ